jgi:hypothetical protein
MTIQRHFKVRIDQDIGIKGRESWGCGGVTQAVEINTTKKKNPLIKGRDKV